MPRHYRVGIVGFGIAGGALAIRLARAGHAVTIFERAPQVGPVGAGFLLQPSGQGVLRRMGLLDSIIPYSEPIDGLHAFKANGQTLAHLRYPEALSGQCAYGVHRGLLFGTLHTAVRAENIPIGLDREIVIWRDIAEGVLAMDANGGEHGPFDFLVAADGSRSRLRQPLNPEVAAREYEFGALWAVGCGTPIRGYLHQVTDGTRHLLGLLPMGGDQCTLFWGLWQHQVEPLRRRGFAAWRGEVVRLSPLAEAVLDDIGSFDRVVFSGYQHVQPRRIYNEHVVCIGDAAHSMSPHLGQGVNLALLDAECLAESLSVTADPLSAFRRYHRRRASQTRYYATLSRLLTPFFQSEGWLLGFGRDLALPLMTAIPPIRRQMELALAGVKTSLFGAIRNGDTDEHG